MEEKKKIKVQAKLKSQNIKAKLDDTGNLTFIIPKTLEEKLKREYDFSVDMLNVGGDIPLADLAIHMDEQPALEYRIGLLAEFSRYKLNQKEDEFKVWYDNKFHKIKNFLIENQQKNLTDKTVESRIIVKYGKTYSKFKSEIRELEMQYRILHFVIRACLEKKGMMLPSIRNIIQGSKGPGIESIASGKKTRKTLKLGG